MFYFKSPGSHFMQDSLARAWGEFIRYVEVDDDQHALRQVDVFRNGVSLRYDRSHWCDDFGMLLGLRFSRKRKWSKFFAGAAIISRAEFEKVWRAAASSSAGILQTNTSRVPKWGPWVGSSPRA